jgi:hypothetical protein
MPTKVSLLAFPPTKFITPAKLLTARPQLPPLHPSPLDATTARGAVITTVLATILLQRGFAHGGLNE